MYNVKLETEFLCFWKSPEFVVIFLYVCIDLLKSGLFPGEMDDVLDSICTFHVRRNFYRCVPQLLVSYGFAVCTMNSASAGVF